jgi:hypothetical protein
MKAERIGADIVITVSEDEAFTLKDDLLAAWEELQASSERVYDLLESLFKEEDDEFEEEEIEGLDEDDDDEPDEDEDMQT